MFVFYNYSNLLYFWFCNDDVPVFTEIVRLPERSEVALRIAFVKFNISQTLFNTFKLQFRHW